MSRMLLKIAVASIAVVFFLGRGEASASDSLTLQYNERPPFMETQADGTVTGIVADPVARAFAKIGVSVSWVRVPVARQEAILQQQETGQVCSVGRYKTPDRERFAKFSNPISQDSPMIGLADPRLKVAPDIRLDVLLADPGISVAIKLSVSYGQYLDAKFAAMKARRIEVSAEREALVHMIEAGHASLTFVPLEEAQYYVRQAGMDMGTFRILHFADMPPGEKRYLMCSHKVPDALIERVNAYFAGQEGKLGQ